MRILLAVVFIFCAAIIYGRSEVVEIYKKSVPTKGAAIKPPLRTLPPFPQRPNPPTLEERKAQVAKRTAMEAFVKAGNAYLAALGYTNVTDTARLIEATKQLGSRSRLKKESE